MSGKTFELNIPDTKAGRVYVGLSWDDIFDITTAKNLTKSDIARAMITALLQPKFIAFYLIFVVLMLSAYMQLVSFLSYINRPYIDLSWPNTLVVVIAATIGFAIYMRAALKKGAMPSLIDGQQKTEDLEGRDEKYAQFDMDLHCFVFDQNKNFLFEIDPTTEKTVNPGESVSVYHSGEETDGAGVYDDETIHIETKKTQDDYSYFVFAVSNDCAFSFDKINNLKIRLVNSLDDSTLHEKPVDSGENDGYVYGCVYRQQDKWFFTPIEKYIKFDENWQNEIKSLLSTVQKNP